MNELLERALRSVPSQGRGSSWVSRRDRALLVLHGSAGLSFTQIAELSASDITVIDGTATITTEDRTVILTSDADHVLCGPCALARWLRTLDMAAAYPDHRVPLAVIARGSTPAAQSPHACQGTTQLTPVPQGQPLLPDVDQWGLIPLPAQPGRAPLPGATTRQLPEQQSAQPVRRAERLATHTHSLLHNDHPATGNT